MSDVRLIFSIQALRALAYGFASILIGAALAATGLSEIEVGVVFTAMLLGMALSTFAVGRWGELIGRRRLYAGLLLVMGLSGMVFALTTSVPFLVLAALTGTMSTDPNESGPITTVEQAMLASAPAVERSRVYGRYNAVAYLAGAAGALAAGGPAALRGVLPDLPADQRWLLVVPIVAVACAVLAARLSSRVEVEVEPMSITVAATLDSRVGGLRRSRPAVRRLAGLFALDAFAGGFIVQTFIVFWFGRQFGVEADVMALAFFGVGLLQAGSSLAAGWLGERIGLLNTMVFTHLPSNVLLAVIPFAPTLPIAVALLLARSALSQMDVPARQAYLAALVDPAERTAAAGYTNAARHVVRPAGPTLAAAGMAAGAGVPFLVAGGLKAVYDLALYHTCPRGGLGDDDVDSPRGDVSRA
jgi:MFS family permease